MAEMKRASTPSHSFRLQTLTQSDIHTARISYKQNGQKILVKSGDEISFPESNVVSCTLTQEETNLFKKGIAYVELRVMTNDGKSMHTDPEAIEVKDVIDDEVLSV